jgi:hypothetical protein
MQSTRGGGPVQALPSAPGGAKQGIIWAMIGRIKGHWQEFKEGKPGHRFQDRYHRRRQDEQGHVLLRVFNIGLGSVIAVGSLALAPLPGPGFLTVFLGLAIVAGELLYAARFLDWCEVWIRALVQLVRDLWLAGVAGKVAVVVVGLALAAGFLYLAYYLLLSG